MIKRFLVAMAWIIFAGFAWADTLQPLPSNQAFAFSSHVEKNQLIVEWKIAPEYFLYRDKMKFIVQPDSTVKIGDVILPIGIDKTDEVHGAYQVYANNVKISVPFLMPAQGLLSLQVIYQGCSQLGFCYPPIKKLVQITVSPSVIAVNQTHFSSDSYAKKLLNTQNKFLLILAFFGLGLLLAFTPCVLPMVPILSSIIVGHHKKITTTKAFFLSLSYVAGMAITYAIAGMVVAMLGSSVQAAMQKTWVIVAVSFLFVMLAFWLLDFYHVTLPARWQRGITLLNQRQTGGSYVGVFFMGVLSTLVVSPCVSAPLVGVLAYIAQTGDVMLGGLTLLAVGMGMGVPLLCVGVSAGKFLPKSGAWMRTIQRVVALIMLGMAVWMLARVLPAAVVLFLWGVLLVFAAILLGVFAKNNRKISKVLSVIALIYGLILMSGAVMGNSDPLRPWSNLHALATPQFVLVKNLDELNKQLALAKQNKKNVMLDFYADWCTSCVLIDKHVLSREDVRAALSDIIVLRADVTQNNASDQAILKKFNVIAPPTILFFSREGNELDALRIVGEVNAEEFLQQIKAVKGN